MANRVKKKRATKAPARKRSVSAPGVAGLKPGASSSASAQVQKSTPARDNKLLYLYGISEAHAPVPAVEGVDGTLAVEAIECGGVTCWVSRVDAREFGEQLQARMENLDWLARASVRHQRVVGAIHEKTTILPARFATLFLSEETLAAHVKSGLRQIHADLRRVQGADEYGIKIFAVPGAAAAAPTAVSGRDYLSRKSQMLRQASAPAITPEVEKFVAGLRAIASESAQGGSVSGGQRNLVWQGSILVPRRARKRLESALMQFSKRVEGFRIECTGPWPAYSFIAVKAEQK